MSSTDGIPCEGWWQQDGFGRQPMHDLRLRFDEFRIFGSGYDIIGPFTLTGGIAEGQVMLAKEYPTHSVFYFGTYDGEGLFFGEWLCGNARDRWLIKIKGPSALHPHDTAIKDLTT